jgi:hypothetical protein
MYDAELIREYKVLFRIGKFRVGCCRGICGRGIGGS